MSRGPTPEIQRPTANTREVTMIIAQLSDPHITLESAVVGLTNAADSFQRAVAHVMRLPARPDLLIISGDCANNGQDAEYARFQELLRPLPMPVYVIPGNHDQRAPMLERFGTQGSQPLEGFVQYVVDSGSVRVLGLDTHVPGHGHGYLCAQRLKWLAARLAEAPRQPTVVMMHHPPFRTGFGPFDQIGLEGADAFEAIIARHPQVERVVTGHVHMALTRRFAGTTAMSCPATAQTLLPDMHRPERVAVLIEPPACLLHEWRDGVGLTTYTSLIGDHGPIVDLHDGTRWL
ncbi:MAG TPA: phosphodiesterase [Roseiflexaceae bacterium]|nr:phosphodiesterase [Roseiflexaceae bacterium]